MKPFHVAIALALLACRPGSPPVQESLARAMQTELAGIADSDVVHLYAARDDALLWLDSTGRLRAPGRAALGLLRLAYVHGLDSLAYDVPRVDELLTRTSAEGTTAELQAEADLALTAGLVRFLDDLRYGRARPASLPKDTTAFDVASAIALAAGADSIPTLVQETTPPFRQYRLLQAALATERTALARTPGDSMVSRQVEMIALALERMRWIPRLAAGRMVIVNIPAFELLALDAPGEAARPGLRSRVVVGDANQTRTPMLFDAITMLEFWPYWNVPRSILLAEILPPLRQDPEYLRTRQMEVVNAQEQVVGDSATPEILAGLADGALSVRQRPSRSNALGVVKFLFPNPASVYAHDTPMKEHFERDRRDLSHGCIRVKKAAALAEWVLADEPGWTDERVRAALRGPVTSRVTLRHPIPILIVYTTALAQPDGSVRYFEDLYGLDQPLLAALRQP